jgi:hypothetical protein
MRRVTGIRSQIKSADCSPIIATSKRMLVRHWSRLSTKDNQTPLSTRDKQDPVSAVYELKPKPGLS